MVTIRNATHDDGHNLADFAARSFRAAFGEDNRDEDMAAYIADAFAPDQIRKELDDSDSLFLLAEISGELAGYAKLRSGQAPTCVQATDCVELERIYADSRFHGAGVGSSLMDAVLARAEAAGHRAIWLGVWEENPRAIAFYLKYGFQRVGEKRFKVGSDLQTDQVYLRHL